jgi:phosphoribosylformylglycinamidine (FGAM) synthase PurS component
VELCADRGSKRVFTESVYSVSAIFSVDIDNDDDDEDNNKINTCCHQLFVMNPTGFT